MDYYGFYGFYFIFYFWYCQFYIVFLVKGFVVYTTLIILLLIKKIIDIIAIEISRKSRQLITTNVFYIKYALMLTLWLKGSTISPYYCL